VSSILLHRLLLAASVFLPASIFAGAAYWNYGEIQRENHVTIERTTAILGEHASKVFDTVEQVLGRIDDRIKGKSWAEIASPETAAFLRSINSGLPQSVSIWITDRNGIHRVGTLDAGVGFDVSGSEWFQAQRDREVGTYVGTPYIGKASRAASFAVSRRRSTPDREFDGTILVSLSPDYFERFFRQAAPPGTHVASLLRRDGTFLARIPARTEGMRLSLGAPLMRAIAESPIAGTKPMISTLDGRNLYFSYRRVGNYPIYVGFGTERRFMLERWYQNVAIYAAVALLSGLTLSLVSMLALRRAHATQAALKRVKEENDQRLLAETRLRQSQKMESLGQLTGGIAHDFNNLLAIILANLEMLQTRVKGDEKSARMVERATRGAERGASLTQRLLAFSRRQDLSPQSVSVPELVEGMTDMLSRSLGTNIRFEAAFPPKFPPAKVDPNQLEVALLNLAVNARDAMPDGGVIMISGRSVVVGPGTHGLASGTYVCVSVSDTGMGMDEDTLSKAVEPFFTTKGTGKGTGLGLSMVHGLAVQSGGTLRITSAKGKGTTAEMWLPVGDEEVPRQPARLRKGNEGFLKILLVDDDALVLEATSAMLEEIGHVVKAASSGKEAIDAMLRDPNIDVVVTDYAMPGMTGLELAETLRRRDPSLPILLATGHAVLPERTGLRVPRLTKPFRKAELEDAIAAVTSLAKDSERDGGEIAALPEHS